MCAVQKCVSLVNSQGKGYSGIWGFDILGLSVLGGLLMIVNLYIVDHELFVL